MDDHKPDQEYSPGMFRKVVTAAFNFPPADTELNQVEYALFALANLMDAFMPKELSSTIMEEMEKNPQLIIEPGPDNPKLKKVCCCCENPQILEPINQPSEKE